MLRESTSADSEAIVALLNRAFAPSAYEARLRELVVAGDEQFFEWVVERNGAIVAHILYTLATDGDGEMVGFHVAPVAVDPSFQRRGIGSDLIRQTLESASLAKSAVFVLGDPVYYERFGFVPTDRARCPFDDGNTHFRALRWKEDGESFEIGYAAAFVGAAA